MNISINHHIVPFCFGEWKVKIIRDRKKHEAQFKTIEEARKWRDEKLQELKIRYPNHSSNFK
jgi:hypothetical protein